MTSDSPPRLLCGVDEAGRGALAGAVFAAAVTLGGNRIAGLADSKALSAARREELAAKIRDDSICCAVAFATVEEIDEFNIRRATMFAMQRAVDAIVVCPDEVWVDGDFVPDLPYPARAVVRGDSQVAEIMAASILAKTARDAAMRDLHREWPDYDFARHKGYGVAAHLRALRDLGPCPCHRRSFAPVREAANRRAAGR